MGQFKDNFGTIQCLPQVSGVIEAVPDVGRFGDEARLPASTSLIARASMYLQDILSFMVLICRLALGLLSGASRGCSSGSAQPLRGDYY